MLYSALHNELRALPKAPGADTSTSYALGSAAALALDTLCDQELQQLPTSSAPTPMSKAEESEALLLLLEMCHTVLCQGGHS